MSDYYQFRDETGTPIDYYQLVNDNNELCKEIERLNNIIDKKEQFLGDNIKRLEREVVKRDNIINEAVEKMRVATLKDRFEVVLNNNLIETKDKYTGFRTILGCRVSYDNLDKNVSFIVREDTKPTYEELETELQQKENIIKELNDKLEDDKMIIEGNWGCIDNLRKDYNLQKNIIKEVREYIEPIAELDNDIMLKGKMLKPVLEILDKANEKENK